MDAPTKEDKLDELMSRMEIHDLAMAYCRGVDRADAELLKTIFTRSPA